MGNLHLRFDEGRAGRATCVAFSPTLPPKIKNPFRKETQPAGSLHFPPPGSFFNEKMLHFGSEFWRVR